MVIVGAFAPRSKWFSDVSEHSAASARLVYVCKLDVEIIRNKECVLYGNVVLAALYVQQLDWLCNN